MKELPKLKRPLFRDKSLINAYELLEQYFLDEYERKLKEWPTLVERYEDKNISYWSIGFKNLKKRYHVYPNGRIHEYNFGERNK